MILFFSNLLATTIGGLFVLLLWPHIKSFANTTNAWTADMWIGVVFIGFAFIFIFMFWSTFRAWKDSHRRTAVFIGIMAIILFGIHYGLRLTDNYEFSRGISLFSIFFLLCVLFMSIFDLYVVRSGISKWGDWYPLNDIECQ